MTVKELIEMLQAFPPELRVVTAGFDEAQVDDIERVEIRKIVFHDDAPIRHCGRHEEHEHGVDAVWIDW